MPIRKLVHVSYSYGVSNGIAHIDECFLQAMWGDKITFVPFIIHPEYTKGREEESAYGLKHISLLDAFDRLYRESLDADVLQFNGAYDPVACNAAAQAGVPALIEIMHQVEEGGLSPSVDRVVCVSDRVRQVQTVPHTQVIYNGIDCTKFSYKEGRRSSDRIVCLQVSNSAKDLHCELGEVAALLNVPDFEAYSIGGRSPCGNITDRGVCTNMPEVFHEADLLFLLEKKAAFGLVFAEAMACGTLPIVSSSAGASAFVEHGKNGWVVDYHTIDDATAVLKEAIACIRTPQLKTMQRNARETVLKTFTQEAMIAAYRSLWEQLGSRSRKKPILSPAWMHYSTASLLFFHKNPTYVDVLANIIAEDRVIEPYFLQHPQGQCTIQFFLEGILPALIASGMKACAKRLCAIFHKSRIYSPLLTRLDTALE
ncbi:MAG: glycosyltransferase family 4 protein [Desulfovibrio sp.]|nr:glycosyltransferase family 4 protein [Desulfovibrio sp.]